MTSGVSLFSSGLNKMTKTFPIFVSFQRSQVAAGANDRDLQQVVARGRDQLRPRQHQVPDAPDSGLRGGKESGLYGRNFDPEIKVNLRSATGSHRQLYAQW